ncbi:hypothetical protein AB6A40_004937 [Gnathostoma spinigerum]|uniref:Major facilitator superfamily (MFS) profile domain-containing protein n=1 Tax=Gnathostoma spinigerum TaxID=75299 RepID=A0ABD6EE45_9BILA
MEVDEEEKQRGIVTEYSNVLPNNSLSHNVQGSLGSVDESDSEDSSLLPEAPDGGYGWIIVMASFLIHFICDGISFSFGVMFPEIQTYYHASKTVSGVVGSVFLAIPLLLGPLAGALTDIYDCRLMTLVGGVLAAAGCFLSFFAFNVWLFVFTFAIITGTGMSFCYNTAIVAVTYYFQKKRALATGIAVCGSGAGTFVIAPIVEFLFAKFGWRYALLVLGAMLLLLLGCGWLIKDLEWPEDTIEYKRRKFIEKTERERAERQRELGAHCENFCEKAHGPLTVLKPRRAFSLPEVHALKYSATFELDALNVGDVPGILRKDGTCDVQDVFSRSKSVGTFLTHFTVPVLNVVLTGPTQTDTTALAPDNGVTFQADTILPQSTIDKPLVSFEQAPLLNSMLEKRKRPNIFRGNMLIDAAAFGTNLRTVRMMSLVGAGAAQGRVPASNVMGYDRRINIFGSGMSRRVPSAPAIFVRRKRKSRSVRLKKMMESLKEWVAVIKSLLRIPAFVIFLISTFVLYVCFDIPYVNFPEYAIQKLNVSDSEASYLVSGIGIMNMFSMLLCGVIADWSRARNFIMVLYGLFIVAAGLCLAIAPYAQTYLELMVLCSGFGFFISANYVLASVITVRILCLYDFQTGYGLLCLVEGLGNLLGPGLVGFLHDHVRSYKFIFLFGGVAVIFSGVMVFFIEVYLRMCGDDDDQSSISSTIPEGSTAQTLVARSIADQPIKSNH